MADLVAELNEMATQHGAEVSVSANPGELDYRIAKVSERFLITASYDIMLQLAKSTLGLRTTIDLSGCRVVSSIELSLIGYIVMHSRFHGGNVRITGASAVNHRALVMVGFDRLVELHT